MCRIITQSELQNKTDIELSALFQKISRQAATSQPGSLKQVFALASLDNIRKVQAQRVYRN